MPTTEREHLKFDGAPVAPSLDELLVEADALMSGDRHQDARELLERALALAPYRVDVRVRLARCVRKLGRPTIAHIILDGVGRAAADHAEILREQGWLAAASGDHAVASERWMRALSRRRQHGASGAEIVEEANELRHVSGESADRLLDAGAARFPGDPQILDARARAHLAADRIGDAMKDWGRVAHAANADARHQATLVNAIRIVVDSSLREARQLAELALGAFPASPWVLNVAGRVSFLSGDFQQATERWLEAAAAPVAESEVDELAQLLTEDMAVLRTRQPAEAERLSTAVIARFRHFRAAHDFLVETLMTLGRPVAAATAMQRAFELNVTVFPNLALSEDPARVQHFVEAVKRQHPPLPALWNATGRALIDMLSRDDEALTLFELVLDPGAPASSDDRITALANTLWCHIRRSALDEAERTLARAEPAWKDAPSVLERVAELLAEREQYDRAVQTMVRAGEGQQRFVEWANALWSRGGPGHRERARRVVDAARAVFPTSESLFAERIRMRLEDGEYKEALWTILASRQLVQEEALITWLKQFGQSDRPALAAQLFQHAHEWFPDSPAVRGDLGEFELKRKRYDRAVATWLPLAEEEPAEKSVLRIALLHDASQFEHARTLANAALARYPEDVLLLYWCAELSASVYENAEALRQFDVALRVAVAANDDTADVMLDRKIDMLRRMGDDVSTDREIALGLQRWPRSWRLIVQRGQRHLESYLKIRPSERREPESHLTRAEADFDEAVSLDPYALPWKIEFLVRVNRLVEAIDLIEADFARERSSSEQQEQRDNQLRIQLEWIKNQRRDEQTTERGATGDSIRGEGSVQSEPGGPSSPFDLTQRVNAAWSTAKADYSSKRSEEILDRLAFAKGECHEVLRLDPLNVSAHGCLGLIYFKLGEFRAAEDSYHRSIIYGGSEGSYDDLGALYLHMKRYREAEESLVDAVMVHENNAEARIDLGNVFLQTGRPEKAIGEFRRALSANPSSERALQALAATLIQMGDLDDAENLIRDATRGKRASECWMLHLRLSELLTRRGDEGGGRDMYHEAVSEVELAVQGAGMRPELRFQMGHLHYRLGDLGKAQAEFEQNLAMDPTDYPAAKNARRIRDMRRGVRSATRVGGHALALLSCVQLVALWWMFLRDQRGLTSPMMLTFVPLLLGLFAVGCLIPTLAEFKLPGLEAKLIPTQSVDARSEGPRGSSPSVPDVMPLSPPRAAAR
jgi:tetratricopeptide (TPR) repeat protein